MSSSSAAAPAVPASAPAAPDATAASSLDIEVYVGAYTGVTRIKRLAFIASASPPHKADAIRMAVAEVKRTNNTALYLELVALAGDDSGLARDDAWVEQVDRRAAQRHDKLEADLNAHKTSLVKESIRMGHNDLGDFHYERGDFNTALKCYVRTRDYCTTSKHILAMCQNVIRASIQMGNFTHVANYITKAESTPDSSDPALVAQLRVAAGLAFLESKKYKLAARKFLSVAAELGSGYSDVASSQDVALYGGLCALASFDRAELKSKVIESPTFRTFLELYPQVRSPAGRRPPKRRLRSTRVRLSTATAPPPSLRGDPPQVREAVNDFYHSRYSTCLASLHKLRPDLSLDLHLHDHASQLYEDIRSRALVQYFSPFVTVDMRLMASAFGATVEALEKELAGLITSKQIHARIDSQNKVAARRRAAPWCVWVGGCVRVCVRLCVCCCCCGGGGGGICVRGVCADAVWRVGLGLREGSRGALRRVGVARRGAPGLGAGETRRPVLAMCLDPRRCCMRATPTSARPPSRRRSRWGTTICAT